MKVMNQRETMEFRTPQHPSLGTNRWGGASPLLARNIPKASLDQVYLRMTTVRTRNEAYLGADAEEYFESRRRLFDPMPEEEEEEEAVPDTPSRSSLKGFLSKIMMTPKRERGYVSPAVIHLCSRSRWFRRFKFERRDYRNRWPQGWC